MASVHPAGSTGTRGSECVCTDTHPKVGLPSMGKPGRQSQPLGRGGFVYGQESS